MGRPDGTPVPGAFGADMAAPVLFEAFARVKPALDPLPPPPPSALLVSTGALPAPLRAFRPRDAVFSEADGRPELAFPPDGALVETDGLPLVVKIAGGTPPFTLLANGAPVLVATRTRTPALALLPGHVMLSVIDAEGRGARAGIELR
jgi:penicillin-binding protein 1C